MGNEGRVAGFIAGEGLGFVYDFADVYGRGALAWMAEDGTIFSSFREDCLG